MNQRLGRLIINNSIISHTDKVRAIEFEGAKLVINGTTLEDCLRGGVQVNRDGMLNIDDCEFYNCKADHGGAIFTDSLYDSTISNSRFTNCVGNYLGGAIYFAYQKYGQFVYRCEYDRCLPDDSILFNQYEEE
ncbi:MAG TPA: right-handed parallel beta-helix repeat-containing protein [Lachnospiraceae bacterium]|nr:right-handed parallel beta-helix repeat-containing protein [Lachnospiraceae bacterium]